MTVTVTCKREGWYCWWRCYMRLQTVTLISWLVNRRAGSITSGYLNALLYKKGPGSWAKMVSTVHLVRAVRAQVQSLATALTLITRLASRLTTELRRADWRPCAKSQFSLHWSLFTHLRSTGLNPPTGVRGADLAPWMLVLSLVHCLHCTDHCSLFANFAKCWTRSSQWGWEGQVYGPGHLHLHWSLFTVTGLRSTGFKPSLWGREGRS